MLPWTVTVSLLALPCLSTSLKGGDLWAYRQIPRISEADVVAMGHEGKFKSAYSSLAEVTAGWQCVNQEGKDGK
jgi:hypothetical protein